MNSHDSRDENRLDKIRKIAKMSDQNKLQASLSSRMAILIYNMSLRCSIKALVQSCYNLTFAIEFQTFLVFIRYSLCLWASFCAHLLLHLSLSSFLHCNSKYSSLIFFPQRWKFKGSAQSNTKLSSPSSLSFPFFSSML